MCCPLRGSLSDIYLAKATGASIAMAQIEAGKTSVPAFDPGNSKFIRVVHKFSCFAFIDFEQ